MQKNISYDRDIVDSGVDEEEMGQFGWLVEFAYFSKSKK